MDLTMIEDWKGILIPCTIYNRSIGYFKDGVDVYRKIFKKLGITRVVEWEFKNKEEEDLEKLARAVGTISNSDNKKSLIIGMDHSLTAFTGKNPESIDYIFFDAHSDDGWKDVFSCGSFVNFMKGDCYFIGVDEVRFKWKAERIDTGKSILLRPREIAKKQFKKRIFLSLDMDVFPIDITPANRANAYQWGCGEMSPQQVKDISLNIIEGKELIGINVAEYVPCWDHKDTEKPHQTADLIVDLLTPLL